MKKTLIALAALAATGAFAQSTVTLSGRASMDVSTWEATGSTNANNNYAMRTRVADTSSRITFAANEDLGGGLKAGVYCETGINIDNATANGQANTANANTSEWCSREGRLYFGNSTAEVRLGRQNVWWTQGEINQSGSNIIGSDTLTNMFNGGVGVLGVRLENMIMAVAGSNLGGFAGSSVYTGFTNGQESAASTATVKGTYSGFKLQYTSGSLIGMIDYQTSADSTTSASTNSFDRAAAKYGIGYKYAPSSIVSLQYWTKERTDKTSANAAYVVGAGTSTGAAAAGAGKDSGYGINLNHDFGNNMMLVAQWSRANGITGTTTGDLADSGATAYSLGGTYRLSKRTHIYAAVHSIKNDANINYGMGGGSYQSGVNQNGSTVSMTALGMLHNF